NRKIDSMEDRGKSELLTAGIRYLSPLLVIQIGMMPMTAYLFNYFSIVSFFMNPPIIAISGLIIPMGIGLIPLSYLGGIIFGVGAQAAELLINAMLWLNELFFMPGIGFFNVVSPPIFLLLIFYGFFFFLSSELFRILYQRRKAKAIAIFCILFITLSLLISIVVGTDYDEAELVFVDVGQGDCLHIRTPEGRNILIDGGGSQNYKVGEKILLPYLLKNGVKSIDLAIATHLHDDHYLGIEQLAGKMKIKQFGTYEANRLREQEILDDTGLQKQDMLYLTEGDRIRIEKDIWIDVLYPEEHSLEDYEKLLLEEKDENRSSLLLKVYYKGLTILMTGDMGLEGEQEIVKFYEENPEILEADVLKIGHHGSRYSTGDPFLDAVSPTIAVFQVGKNNFGHPHPTVIDKCEKKGIINYRNDLNGAIIFTYDENLWNVGSMIF
ncbi:MAG TPA: ComEC/Rec2 family competence protein, partial [Anaerovoracaceae bacterium]|nr:ComEC/Rec2 family competence protein [Anaerovoracaceae bacterium]